jgi:UDP-glucose 4-epimerase
MNTLVTGATGFIGSHLCKELIHRGHTVFGLSRSGRTHKIKSFLNQKEFYLKKGDIRDERMLSEIIKDNNIKVIFHLAAQLPQDDDLKNPFLCFDINVRGTLNLLNAAYLNDIDYFMYGSTMSVYSDPPDYLPVDEKHSVRPSTVYGVSKLASELYCNLYSKFINMMIIRFSGVYGWGQSKHNAIPRFINQALNNRPITIYGDGTQTSDYIYVKDAIQAILLAWEKNKTGIYNIGGGEEISVKDLAKRIVSSLNSKSEIVLTGRDTNRPFRFFFDIKKSRKDLNYSPRSFNAGLSMYLSEFDIEDSEI